MTCEACRTIPPVISEGYTPKGTSSAIDGLDFDTCIPYQQHLFKKDYCANKTDITGPTTAKTAILTIYDIFGNSPQTTQGADLLAARLNALVLIPDFFKGNGAKQEWIPPDTEEKTAALMAFVSEKASWVDAAKGINGVVNAYRAAFQSVEKWGAYGLCWGGKVLALSSGDGSPFSGTVQVHPG